MRAVDSLFYPEQRVTGHVTAMNDCFATINTKVRHYRWKIVLSVGSPSTSRPIICDWEKGYTPWFTVSTAKTLCIVVVPWCRAFFGTASGWIACLCRTTLGPSEHYPVGSILELEFLDYANFYTAHARTESGLVIELMSSDLHAWGKSSDFAEPLQSHQFIQIAIRQFSARTVRSKRLK